MVSSTPAQASRSPTPAASPTPARWRLALLAGLCFGLGYGVVQRLMSLELPRGGQLSEPFRMRQFPGTSLESLRLRQGEDSRPIRGDLGLLEQEEQQRKAEEERREREKVMEAERQRQTLSDTLNRDLELAPAPVPLPAAEPAPMFDDEPLPLREPPAPALPEPFTP